MGNVEHDPVEQTVCSVAAAVANEPDTELLHPREVPLGGPRAMRVRRALPNRDRRMVGAWCFADSYGPTDIGGQAGMQVPPHPHTGLQTVTEDLVMWWNFVGRSREDIVDARTTWESEHDTDTRHPRFGPVDGCDGPALPAPSLPNARLKAKWRYYTHR